ncbi:MAG: efflux transporter periplasmic adaptor subunit [Sutterella sp. 54_7]|nr:MAG: efflux transporter periplasmic adaptor subunit [Sutterella sp. 54_7]
MLAGCKTQSSAPAPREPLPVDIVAVKAADEAHWLETIGQAEAAAAVSVTTQATGRIIAQRYTEGDFVEAGAVLFEIDPANLKTQLASAEASRRALEVEFAQADREFQRAEKLWKAQAASQKDYDDAKSLKNKTANELAQARAAENEARINLDWTAVRAPASGYVSKALFNPGSVVVKDSTVLATITQKNDVRVLFAPSDRDLAGADISTATRVRVFRASGEELPASLDYVAQTFDAKNGTRTMRAKIPADSGVLPGEFLRIRFMTAVDRGAWRVPQRCVKQLPDGTYAVFVMQDGKAIQKAVEVGLWEGTDWIVTKGLADGDLVITNQLIKLQNGTAVKAAAKSSEKTAG